MASDVKKHLEKTIKKSSPDDIRTIKAKGKATVPLLLIIPAMTFFLLFTIIPLIKVVIDSMGLDSEGYKTSFGLVWSDSNWYIAIFNSLVYSIVSVPLTLIIALLISFSISNIIRKKFREFWQTIFFLPYITSTIAISIVFSEIFSAQEYGIVNWILGTNIAWVEQDYNQSPIAFVPILVFGIWHSLAFKVLILTSAMLSIDKRLYDAASIDGASKKDMFFNITMPALNATLWYLITIGLIGSLKVFPIGMFEGSSEITMNRFPTMLTYVYDWVKKAKYANAGAASISLIFVIICFNIAIRKGMKAIENHFSTKKEKEVQKEINAYNSKDKEVYEFSKTSELSLEIDEHLKSVHGGDL